MIQNFFNSINIRLILIHFIAFWLFIYGFQTLAFLHDHDFFKASLDRINALNFPARYSADKIFVQQSGILGLLLGYIISWSISTRRGWFWASAAIGFITAFIFRVYGLLLWDRLHGLFAWPGSFFNPDSIWGYIVNAVFMIGLGCIIFFWNRIIHFIDKGEKVPVNFKAKALAERSRPVKPPMNIK